MRFCKQCGSIYPSETQYCPVHGALLETRDEFAVGTVVLGRYEILRHLGSGAMADVYLVRDAKLYSGNLRAMKVPNARFATDGQNLRKFVDEANKAILLNHPRIVRCFHLDTTESGLPLFLMEFVEGQSLRWWMDRDPKLQWRHAVEITLQVAEALESAHADGVVHCDIKPENVKATGMPNPTPLKVLDFGLGKGTNLLLNKMGGTDHGTVWGGDVIAGTYEYMSPEQAIAREKIGPPSDIYSLGVVLYEMLTGTVPFVGIRSVEEARRTHQDQRPGSLHGRRELPSGLAELVESMLDRSPERRPTATEVIQKIKELGGSVIPPPQQSSNGRRIAAVAAGIVFVIGLVLLMVHRSSGTQEQAPEQIVSTPGGGPPSDGPVAGPSRISTPGSVHSAPAHTDLNEPEMGRLVISCDVSCNWTLNGRGGTEGQIESGGSRELQASAGEHSVQASATDENGILTQQRPVTVYPAKNTPVSFNLGADLQKRSQQIAQGLQQADSLCSNGKYPLAFEAYKEVIRLAPNKLSQNHQAAENGLSSCSSDCRIQSEGAAVPVSCDAK